MTREMQRASLDALKDLNQEHYAKTGDMEIASRIASYELAFRMQMNAPELLDFSKESPETLKLYGVEVGKPSFAMNCLLARRLIERGVRFVQLFHEGWDHHSEVVKGVKDQTARTDQASAALVKRPFSVVGGPALITPSISVASLLATSSRPGNANNRPYHRRQHHPHRHPP